MCENIIGRGHPAIDSSIRIIQSKSSSSQPTNIEDLNIHEPHHDPESRSTEKFSKQDSLPALEHYSVFTVRQKKTILMAGSFAAFFSPLSSNVYFPAINTIARDLHVSISQINLTVTTYQIMQGIAPMIVANISDENGRRPAYLVCFVFYMAANLGLALQNSFAALIGLRLLQSAGSSGTIALSIALVGDTVVPAERGVYIAWASLGDLVGPSISPIVGGLIAQKLDWHWIFWILLILGACFFLPFLLFLPETCRTVVGNGSIPPPLLNWSLTDLIRYRSLQKEVARVDQQQIREAPIKSRFRIPNPLPTLRIAGNFESFLLLLTNAFARACFYAITTDASASFNTIYGFDDIQVSLMFIPIGIGGIASALVTGQLTDWNFRRHARRLRIPIVANEAQNLTDFPIEQARLELGLPLYLAMAVFVINYGWLLEMHVSIAGPIVILFVTSFMLCASMQVLNTLMIDLWPGKPAAATAANNLFRCEIGAAASGAIQPMIESIGRGWAYTTFALISVAFTPLLVFMIKRGMPRRKANLASKEEDSEA